MQTTPAIGTVVSQDELENLPLNGRQFANLAVLAPGTALVLQHRPDQAGPAHRRAQRRHRPQRQLRHRRRRQHRRHDRRRAAELQPRERSQEFKIQTQQYKAEYGRSTGGVLTVVTKTGTNDFNGSAYGFFRDDSLNVEDRDREAGGHRQAAPTTASSTALRSAGRSSRTRSTSSPPTRRPTATTDLHRRHRRHLPDPRRPVGRAAVQGRAGHRQGDLRHLAQAVPAGPLRLPEEHRQVRREPARGARLARHGDQRVQVDPRRPHRAARHATRSTSSSSSTPSSTTSITADSNDPTLYYPSGVHFGQNINTPQTHQPDEVPVQGRLQLLDGRSAASATTSRPASTTSTSRRSAATSPPASPASSRRSEDRAGLADHRHHHTTAASRRHDPGQAVQRLLPGRLVGQRPPDPQPRPALRLLGRLRPRPALQPDLADASTQTTVQRVATCATSRAARAACSRTTTTTGRRASASPGTSRATAKLVRGGWGIYYDFPYTNATILFPAAAVQSDYGVAYNYNDPQRHQEPRRQLLPARPAAAAQPAAGRRRFPPERGRLADAGARRTPTRPRSATRCRSTSWLGLNFEPCQHQLPRHPVPLPRQPASTRPPATGASRSSATSGSGIGDGEADYHGANLGFRARVSDKFELQGFYTYSEAEGNVLGRRRRVPPHRRRPPARPRRRRARRRRSTRSTRCDALRRPAQHRRPPPRHPRRHLSRSVGIDVSGMFRYRSALPYTRLVGLRPQRRRLRLRPCPGVDHVNAQRGDSLHAARPSPLEGLHASAATTGSSSSPRCSTSSTRRTRPLFEPLRRGQRLRRRPGPGRAAPAQLGVRFHF